MTKKINEQYMKMLEDIMTNGMETKPRGMAVRELLGYSLMLDPEDNVITVPGVETNVSYAAEELEWYLSGTNRIDWSERIQRVWTPFSDDGETINSNYGHRFFGDYDRSHVNQWEWVKDKLRSDPDSRQAVMNINDIVDKESPTKDFPCTIATQVFLRNDKLDWVTFMRSNDAFLGFRNDVYCFTELQKKMAGELGVEAGQYHHVAGSMHIYERNFEKIEKALEAYKNN
jgi:thymidylate synthase